MTSFVRQSLFCHTLSVHSVVASILYQIACVQSLFLTHTQTHTFAPHLPLFTSSAKRKRKKEDAKRCRLSVYVHVELIRHRKGR